MSAIEKFFRCSSGTDKWQLVIHNDAPVFYLLVSMFWVMGVCTAIPWRAVPAPTSTKAKHPVSRPFNAFCLTPLQNIPKPWVCFPLFFYIRRVKHCNYFFAAVLLQQLQVEPEPVKESFKSIATAFLRHTAPPLHIAECIAAVHPKP